MRSLPDGYDVVLVANLIHYWSPEENQALLRRIRAAVGGGTRLLLADFWTNVSHTQPLHAALMAGEFAVHLRDGDVYSVEEIRAWLSTTGWRFIEHAPAGWTPERGGRRRQLRSPITAPSGN